MNLALSSTLYGKVDVVDVIISSMIVNIGRLEPESLLTDLTVVEVA